MAVAQQRDSHSGLFREALASSSVGWEIALPIGGGALLGQLIDRLTGRSILFTIIFLLFGAISGFYNLARHVQRLNAQKTVTKGRPISDEEWEAWDYKWEEAWEEDWETDDWHEEEGEEKE